MFDINPSSDQQKFPNKRLKFKEKAAVICSFKCPYWRVRVQGSMVVLQLSCCHDCGVYLTCKVRLLRTLDYCTVLCTFI